MNLPTEKIIKKMSLRWIRSNGPISGVCGGLAKALHIQPWIIRTAFVGALLFFGTGLVLYLFLWIALPSERYLDRAYDKRFLGVCARVAKSTDIEVGIVRLGAIFLFICSMGPAIIGYFILFFIAPPLDS